MTQIPAISTMDMETAHTVTMLTLAQAGIVLRMEIRRMEQTHLVDRGYTIATQVSITAAMVEDAPAKVHTEPAGRGRNEKAICSRLAP